MYCRKIALYCFCFFVYIPLIGLAVCIMPKTFGKYGREHNNKKTNTHTTIRAQPETHSVGGHSRSLISIVVSCRVVSLEKHAHRLCTRKAHALFVTVAQKQHSYSTTTSQPHRQHKLDDARAQHGVFRFGAVLSQRQRRPTKCMICAPHHVTIRTPEKESRATPSPREEYE